MDGKGKSISAMAFTVIVFFEHLSALNSAGSKGKRKKMMTEEKNFRPWLDLPCFSNMSSPVLKWEAMKWEKVVFEETLFLFVVPDMDKIEHDFMRVPGRRIFSDQPVWYFPHINGIAAWSKGS
ncbi:ADP-ribosyltransferase binding protein [Corchorus olitorius]|uniref:ADP-ribosyltransferase binding protein n=1 Tax=Corchorus olitorius TaxID=93759 RepID=A0A1R3HAT1_9ROSI|nr:ADP-ribosyltransferase binding protein [Corchorus olitorius]